MSTRTERSELKLEVRRLITCFRDCWVVATNYLYEIAPKRYPPHNEPPMLDRFRSVNNAGPVPIAAEVLAGVWNALLALEGCTLRDIGDVINEAQEHYQFSAGIYPDEEQVNPIYRKARRLVDVYQCIYSEIVITDLTSSRLARECMRSIQGYESLSLDSIDVEGIEAKANTYLLHQEQASLSIDDVLNELFCPTPEEELARAEAELKDYKAENQALKSEISQLKQAPAKGQEMEELETIKKELESKAQALAEALGRIAELEQEIAGLQAKLEGATEEELDEGVDTPYTYIARQPKDRNRRMGMLVAIIERAEGAGLLEKQMNTQRLKWSEDFNNTQIAYFVARANSLLGIKAKRYKATNWGVWCRLIDGLKSTQLSQGKTDYTRQDEDGKPDNYEIIDGLFVSL